MHNIISKIKHLLGLVLSLLYLLSAKTVWASTADAPNIQLQIPLFGYTQAADFAQYLGKIYEVALYILVPFAIVVIIFSGVLWVMSGGDRGLITKAKERMLYAFVGLGIALGSYLILSLFNLTTLTVPNVEYISPQSGDLLWISDSDVTTVSGGGEAKLPAGRKGSAQAYQNMACPKGQGSFDVFFTFYYKPKYADPGGHDHIPKYENFWCNVGMQCSCPNGKSGHCASHGNPCAPFGAEVPYCNSTGGNKKKPPIGGYTIAGEIRHCFKRGCKIMIEGKGPYEIHDAGSPTKITGLHMDYFVDFQAGKGIPPPAGVYKVTVVDPASCYQ